MENQNDVLLSNLTELAYSKWASEYSKGNWMSNEPLFSQLSDSKKKFWKQFVIGIKSNFKTDKSEGFDLYKETNELQKKFDTAKDYATAK